MNAININAQKAYTLQVTCGKYLLPYLLVKFDLLLKKDLMGGFDVFHSLLVECVHLHI